MSKFRKGSVALAGAALTASGLAWMAAPATAMHNSEPPCLVVTASTTLTGNLSGCTGHGIVVTASNITLDLGGFTVSGMQTPMEQAGVLLDDVSGVTVRNGTVTGFDAGVSIEFGGGNTVTGITATANVNDMMEPVDPRAIIIDRTTGPTPQQRHDISLITCNYGDGITTLDSSGNTITGNTVTENGPYAGISLVGDSNRNSVSGNHVAENDLLNNGVTDGAGNPVFVSGGFHVPAGTAGATMPQSMCGATEVGTPGMGRGREVQSIGIRVEGPGSDENVVSSNTVTKGGLAGISFHSYVLNPAASNVEQGDPNRYNVVSANRVSHTGDDTNTRDSFADGIASLASGPAGLVTRPSDTNTITGNISSDNFRHGISLGRLSYGFTVSRNTVNNNGDSGIWVAGPVPPNPGNPAFDFRGANANLMQKNKGTGNGVFDGFDGNPDCGTNRWVANNLQMFNIPCIVPGSVPHAAATAGTTAASAAGMAHSRS